MKRIYSYFVSPHHVPDECYAQLVRLCPEFDQSGCAILGKLAEDDARLAEFQAILDNFGCYNGRGKPKYGPVSYEMSRLVEYSASEINSVQYLWPFIEEDAGETMASPTGVTWFILQYLNRNAIMAGGGPGIVVSSAFRRELEESGLIGFAFEATEVVEGESYDAYRVVPWEKVGCEPYWLLRSTIKLPPVSPRCVLLDKHGQPVSDRLHVERGVRIAEGEYPVGEIHYRRSDIQKVEPFDWAETLEPLHPAPGQFSHIMSQRFRTLCEKHGFDMSWHPIFIDDE